MFKRNSQFEQAQTLASVVNRVFGLDLEEELDEVFIDVNDFVFQSLTFYFAQ